MNTSAPRTRRQPNPGAKIDPKQSSLYVQSVEKAMTVLKAFDGSKRQLTLSEIVVITGFDLSSAQRFTHTLFALGYLTKDPDSKAYSLSPKLLDFTYHYLSSSELVSRATPYLQQLAAQTEETVNLTVLDGPDIVYVLRIVSRNMLNAPVIVGSRLPAYCTAPGLAILSTFDEGEVDAILAQSNLVAHTEATVWQPRRIKARLALIKKQHYAHTEDEYYARDISTAAAITNAQGRAIGAINVAVARPRWNDGRDEKKYADLLISAASAISSQRLV